MAVETVNGGGQTAVTSRDTTECVSLKYQVSDGALSKGIWMASVPQLIEYSPEAVRVNISLPGDISNTASRLVIGLNPSNAGKSLPPPSTIGTSKLNDVLSPWRIVEEAEAP